MTRRRKKSKKWYKSEEVQAIFNVSYWTVLRWAKAGRFGAIKIGSWYFLVEEVDNAGKDGSRSVLDEGAVQ